MTITFEAPRSAAAASALAWHAPRAGVWVARRDGCFVGIVEAHWGSGFSATTHLGKHLGMFPTVREARAALEEHCVGSNSR